MLLLPKWYKDERRHIAPHVRDNKMSISSKICGVVLATRIEYKPSTTKCIPCNAIEFGYKLYQRFTFFRINYMMRSLARSKDVHIIRLFRKVIGNMLYHFLYETRELGSHLEDLDDSSFSCMAYAISGLMPINPYNVSLFGRFFFFFIYE